MNVVADPNSTLQSRSTTLNFSAGGVSRAITVNQDGIPLMPVVGLTSLADNWNGSVTLSFNAVGFSTTSLQNDNGYEPGITYLSVKMNAQLPSVSESSDTYWVTRGALLLADSFENELRACMKLIQERFPVSFNSCFVYGFGSTHMWVTEPGRKERLIFVEF